MAGTGGCSSLYFILLLIMKYAPFPKVYAPIQQVNMNKNQLAKQFNYIRMFEEQK
jgi:hypothetical protein